jgi:hypothetical protein
MPRIHVHAAGQRPTTVVVLGETDWNTFHGPEGVTACEADARALYDTLYRDLPWFTLQQLAALFAEGFPRGQPPRGTVA